MATQRVGYGSDMGVRQPITPDSSRWEADSDAVQCFLCCAAFKASRRRHHCRFCGKVVCAKCSSRRVNENRACDQCWANESEFMSRRPGWRAAAAESDGHQRSASTAAPASGGPLAYKRFVLPGGSSDAQSGAQSDSSPAAVPPGGAAPGRERRPSVVIPPGASGLLGTLVVEVHRAEGLRAADLGGTSDPYAVLVLSGENSGGCAWPSESVIRQETEHIAETLNPVWRGAVLHFPVASVGPTLTVQLWDHDQFSADDELGEATIPISAIAHGRKVVRSARLHWHLRHWHLRHWHLRHWHLQLAALTCPRAAATPHLRSGAA